MRIDKQYQRAYENAPEEVRVLIRAFMKKPKEYRNNVPLLWFILGRGNGTPPYKMSKSVSNYNKVSTSTENCGNCRFTYMKVIDKKYICSQIRGAIKPEAWCKLWKGK